MNTAKDIQRSFVDLIAPSLILNRDAGSIDMAFASYIDGLCKDRIISKDAFENINNPISIVKGFPMINIDEETEFLSVEEEEKQENEDY